MASVQKDDTQLKKFLERTLGLQILRAGFVRGTLTYTMRGQDGETVVLEQRPDTSTSIRVGDVTRTIPTKVEVERMLGHEPSELEMCRLIQQVYDKILEQQEDEDRRNIRGDFQRFSRRGW
jgi:hypothetical protein